jgi:hypothetical protein
MTIPNHAARLDWRAGLVLTAALFASFGMLIGTAGPVAACSCAMPGSMKEYATPENAVFTGTAGEHAERGVPVEVKQWLWPQDAPAEVWLSAASFGDSAGCGTTAPEPGTSWIWVTWRPENQGDFQTGLCSPAAPLDSPEGEQMLAEALAVFSVAPLPEASSEPTSAPQAPSDPGSSGAGRDASMLAIGGAVALASLAMFGAVAMVARRQDRRDSGRL